MRIAMGIEYDGSRYFGWQRQREVNSIQAELERVLSQIANHPVEVQCAGRTDAGVHATGQVIHFDTHAERKMAAWTLGVNSNLPADIAVRWAQVVPDDFHARFSATARRYRYLILNSNLRPAILAAGISHYHGALDAQSMHNAGQRLLGEHDFTSFRAVQCQAKSPVKTVHHLEVIEHGRFIVIDVRANAFLHHMVRNFAGVLMTIGAGEREPGWVAEVLAARDRRAGGVTAHPYGLYLVQVEYPPEFELPQRYLGPHFLSALPQSFG